MYDPIWKAAAGHLSAERMRDDIEDFFSLSRWSSYDRILALARRIAERMEAIGLSDVRLIEAPADGKTAYGGWVMPKAYDVEGARLSLLAEDGTAETLVDYQANPTCLMLYSLPTPAEGITADLVVADSREECRPERVAGRLVLASRLGVEFSQAAMRAGACGIISDGRFGHAFFKEGAYLDQTNEWHNCTIPPWGDPGKGFGFAISPDQGRRLRARIGAGQTVRLNARVTTRHYDGVLPVVSGRLPGRQDDEIVLTGHYDEFGADDNCSQVAVALESIRAIREMVLAGEIPPLARSIRLLFPMEVRGFNALVQDPDEIRNLRVGLNIDTVGTDQNAVTSTCNLAENFAALPSFAEEFVAELLRRVAAENPLFRWRRTGAETIDNIFGEPLIGVPTPCIYHYSATHHVALDTPERISGRMLRDMARVTTTFAAFLANAGLKEALWLSEVVADHGIARLHEGMTGVLGITGESVSLSLQRADTLRDAYQRRLDSARWLVPGAFLFPSEGALATAGETLLGEGRLLPREYYAERVTLQQQRIDRAHAEAVATIRRRAAEFFPPSPTDGDGAAPASTIVPLKTFKGFLGFEDLDAADHDHLTGELGVDFGWGAPLWLQNALFFANGKRTAGEIATLLRRHGSGESFDVPCLEAVFTFLARRGLVRLRPYLTQAEIRRILERAGLTSGDIVLGHFSLSRFGYIEGGADALIDTLLDVLGPEGTLMMPTFTCSWIGRPPFDPARTPSGVGAVTDRFWRRTGVRRSDHPTHSFAAAGKQAAHLLEGHDASKPPFSKDGPLGRLADADGRILLFAPKENNTVMHAGEYWSGIPYVDFVCPVVSEGGRREVIVPHCPWHAVFDPAYDWLYARGLVQDVPLGESTVHAMRGRDAIEAQAEVARQTPEALLPAGCDCPYCRGLKRYCAGR
jgi:aminoglycoside 3-N-acetyltransferase